MCVCKREKLLFYYVLINILFLQQVTDVDMSVEHVRIHNPDQQKFILKEELPKNAGLGSVFSVLIA